MSASKYTGHGARTGGLQGHSVGDLYPLIVYGQETADGLRWGIQHAASWLDTGPIFTSEQAHQRAAALKHGRCKHACCWGPFSLTGLQLLRAGPQQKVIV